MILRMNKVRILGPRERYPEALRVLQDAGAVHLTVPGPDGRLLPLRLSTWQEREHRHLRRLLVDVEALLEALPAAGSAAPPAAGAAPEAGSCGGAPARLDLTRWAHLVRSLQPDVLRLRGEMAALVEEDALLVKYRPFLSTFEVILRSERAWPHIAAYHVDPAGSRGVGGGRAEGGADSGDGGRVRCGDPGPAGRRHGPPHAGA